MFLIYKLCNYHYIHQQKPAGHEFTLGTGSSIILTGNHFHFLKEPFARFRFAITELKYRTLCVRKTWRSFESLLPQMSRLSQSVKGKMTFWYLDPVWSPACPNPRVESNDVKRIFIFVLFNKYYCVLSKNFVTYSTATQIHLYYLKNSYDNLRQNI